MTRKIDPPRSQFDTLLTPLTAGELCLIDLLDQALPVEWELYVQPHLNGLRPDLVLINPNAGIAVFEVKDWDFDAMRYFVEEDVQTGQPRLMAEQGAGNRFSREHDNPVSKIRLYKRELFDLYCPRLNDRSGIAAITGGLVFSRARRSDLERVFGPLREKDEGVQKFPQYYPIASLEDIVAKNVGAIFPEYRRVASKVMSPEVADDLRAWLKEPAFSTEQLLPLEMDSRQRDLATT